MTGPDRLPLAIVIPTLNACAYLRSCLATLELARRLGATVIVVDGGSSDDTVAIAREHGVQVVTAAGSMYAALNAGFHVTEEPWLTWINADDILFCDQLPSRLRATRDADVSYGRVDFIDTQGRFIHSWLSAAPRALGRLYQSGYSPLLQQGTLFRRKVFERLGGFNESYRFVGDADFWWRAVTAGFVFTRSHHPPVAAFRIHSGQLSATYAGEMNQEHWRMVAGNGGRCRAFSLAALALWRLENLGAYGIRFLRRSQLDGTMYSAASYDIPRYDL
jgi:glycosyltransferase involved in cell wall biosynthesis